ncbi:MAG TPA: hypothetical protein VH855_27480 [Acetobacteraceae bacterium]|jgi:hypothetical protein
MALTREWRIHANGYDGHLEVTADAAGHVTGTVRFGGEPDNQLKAGFWDETSKKLVFTRVIDPNDSSKDQIYTGYWFPRNHTQPNGPSDLAGSFVAFAGTGGTPARHIFGWHATHG